MKDNFKEKAEEKMNQEIREYKDSEVAAMWNSNKDIEDAFRYLCVMSSRQELENGKTARYFELGWGRFN